MKEKKILIFGAGINQLTLIQACNDLGYESIVIDPNTDAPGKALSGVFVEVAPGNYEKTTEVAQFYQVDGIATSQMENPLMLMARLAKELGFIFNSPEILEKSLNKYLMKKAFIENKVPHARGLFFSSKEELEQSGIKGLAFPLIIKPVDSHSSRGVYKVESFEQLISFVDETMSFSKSGSFLIEEFIEGPEFSVETITFNGETTIVQYTEKIITPFPNVVELGHIQPAELSDKQKTEIDKIVKNGIQSLGLNSTVCHTEVKLSKKGPVIIEIGPRMGGDFISSYLVKYSCGIDLDKATIQMSIGKRPDLEHSLSQYTIIKYLQLKEEKIVKSIGEWNSVLDLPGVIFANLNIKVGEIIPKITDSAKRPGFIVVKGNTRENVINKAEMYLNNIKKTIKYYD